MTHRLISQEVWPDGLTEAWLGHNHPAMTSGMTENPQCEADLLRLLGRLVEDNSDLVSGLESGSQDRWLLASALQKAIRRGSVGIAVGTALEVLDLNASYLWRRLCVVALEDIGFGDPLTCARRLETRLQRSRKFRARRRVPRIRRNRRRPRMRR